MDSLYATKKFVVYHKEGVVTGPWKQQGNPIVVHLW